MTIFRTNKSTAMWTGEPSPKLGGLWKKKKKTETVQGVVNSKRGIAYPNERGATEN